MKTNRRSFITKSIIGASLLTNANLFSAQAESLDNLNKSKRISIRKDDVILFQGDSITDNGRDRKNKNANDNWALGSGYANLAAAVLLEKYADKLKIDYQSFDSTNSAFQKASRDSSKDDTILVTGSNYLFSEINLENN